MKNIMVVTMIHMLKSVGLSTSAIACYTSNSLPFKQLLATLY